MVKVLHKCDRRQAAHLSDRNVDHCISYGEFADFYICLVNEHKLGYNQFIIRITFLPNLMLILLELLHYLFKLS